MKRREFITLLGGAAVTSPLAAQAQQPRMPVIGFLGITFASERPERLAAFKRGLGESGFADGRNVLIEIRWAENRYDRFQELAADLVRHKVDVIVAPGTAVAIGRCGLRCGARRSKEHRGKFVLGAPHQRPPSW